MADRIRRGRRSVDSVLTRVVSCLLCANNITERRGIGGSTRVWAWQAVLVVPVWFVIIRSFNS
jgi:hypothetical protein